MTAKTYHAERKSQQPGASGQRQEAPPQATVGSPGEGSSLPCLYSNISIENRSQEALKGLISLLSPYHKKAAQTLYLNVSRLLQEVESLCHVGFLTLTFKENLTDNAEAARRFDSFNTNFLLKDPRFGTKIAVKEPQKRGAWHYHILVALSGDIKEGFDFDAYTDWLDGKTRFKTPCPTGNAYIRQLWKDLRIALKQYGFGPIFSLEPVRSNSEAMGRYIGKYISKGIEQRNPDHKGVRLVNYSKGWLRNSPKFAWNTTNSAEWRRKVSLFAKTNGCSDLYQLSEKLGSDWAYRFIDQVIDAQEHFIEDRTLRWKYQQDGSRIHRDTGEVQKEEDYLYQDRKIKATQANEKNRFHLLWAEAKGELNGRETYRQQTKKKRKKEKEKNAFELLMINSKLHGCPSMFLKPEEMDENGKLKRSTPEEQAQREAAARARLLFRKEERESEKEELRQLIKSLEEEKEWLKTLPEAPF